MFLAMYSFSFLFCLRHEMGSNSPIMIRLVS